MTADNTTHEQDRQRRLAKHLQWPQ